MGRGPLARGRGGSAWGQLLLLAACLLSLCFPMCQGQMETLNITMDPPAPKVGTSVSFKPPPVPPGSFFCRWFRRVEYDPNMIFTYYMGGKNYIMGPELTSKMTPRPDCSLRIQHLTSNDSGIYKLKMERPMVSSAGEVDLKVIEPPKKEGEKGGGGGGGLSSGTIVGIVIGCLAGVIDLGGVLDFTSTKTSREPKRARTMPP